VQGTKIVVTIGPASASAEGIARLVRAGADVVRVNASHGSHEQHAQIIDWVREVAGETGRAIAVLYDLQGPKIRLGDFPGSVSVQPGDALRLAMGAAGPGELPCAYASLADDVRVGDPLLIDDGTIECVVASVEPERVVCTVKNAGTLTQRKGLNLPACELSTPALTDKDRADARFADDYGVDLFALSFVRRAADLQMLIDYLGHGVPIVAKIEKPQALDHLEEILEVAWGVMVARGDLGVELPPEAVPMAQKRIIEMANKMARPVITATQMLDSMRHNPRPTRAEASDVANAVLDGTDAVMLSGETASGAYPEESVQMMARIIEATRGRAAAVVARRRERRIDSVEESVADACCQAAHHLRAKALVSFTRSGRTAILVSSRRAQVPHVAFTPSPTTRNRLALVWGVQPMLMPEVDTLDDRVARVDAAVRGAGLAAVGDRVVLAMGDSQGRTNTMIVHGVQ
jgi:pyruvate kinase